MILNDKKQLGLTALKKAFVSYMTEVGSSLL